MSYRPGQDEEAIPMDLELIPQHRVMWPLVEQYVDIVESGKAAVHPKTFANRADAIDSHNRFAGVYRYYRERHPELGLPADISFRSWESESTGGFRWAMLPVRRSRGLFRAHRGGPARQRLDDF